MQVQQDAETDVPRVTGLDVIDAIRARRSIGKVRPEAPPRELITQLLDAAAHAPNHHLTAPWRFFVLAGDARSALGAALADGRARLTPGAGPAELDREQEKPLRAPVVIAVAVQPAVGPHVFAIEEIAAVSAAVQNLLLAAHALGLAAIWRTGDTAYSEPVRDFLGLDSAASVLGFVYIGYAAAPPKVVQRRPAEAVTRWLGWDEPAPGGTE